MTGCYALLSFLLHSSCCDICRKRRRTRGAYMFFLYILYLSLYVVFLPAFCSFLPFCSLFVFAVRSIVHSVHLFGTDLSNRTYLCTPFFLHRHKLFVQSVRYLFVHLVQIKFFLVHLLYIRASRTGQYMNDVHGTDGEGSDMMTYRRRRDEAKSEKP